MSCARVVCRYLKTLVLVTLGLKAKDLCRGTTASFFSLGVSTPHPLAWSLIQKELLRLELQVFGFIGVKYQSTLLARTGSGFGLARKCRRVKPALAPFGIVTHGLRRGLTAMPPLRG